MNIKKGDVLKYKANKNLETKVLGIVDDLYFMQDPDSRVSASKYTYTLEGLKEAFELPEEKWVPKEASTYFYIHMLGTPIVCHSTWLPHPIDTQRYDSGNCFPTKKAAEAKLAEVLLVLKK